LSVTAGSFTVRAPRLVKNFSEAPETGIPDVVSFTVAVKVVKLVPFATSSFVAGVISIVTPLHKILLIFDFLFPEPART